MAPNPNFKTIGPIDLFRPGTFTAMEGRTFSYSAGDVRAMADSYDPENAPAPIVVGHPSIDAPAYGWVDRLDVQEGILRGTIRDMVPAFADAVKNWHYRKISISLFPPDHPANPMPGVNYLRHVGFLGAKAPVVPGLKPVHFAAHEGTVEFALDLDTRSFAGAEGGDTVPGLLSRLRGLLGKGDGAGAPRPDPRDQAALDAVEAITALREENTALRAELDALKPSEPPEETAEFAAMRSQVETFRRDRLDRDLERLIDQGRLLPVLKAQVLDFAAGLDAAETVSFAAGGQTTQRDWFLDFLARQPVTVSFGSCIPTEGPLADDSRAFDHMPAGYSADPTHEPIYRRARPMPGITIEVDLDTQELQSRLKAMIARLDAPEPLYRSVGETVHGNTLERFRREIAPTGIPWEKLRRSTLRNRVRKGRSPLGILRMEGDLINSVNYQVFPDGVKLGANTPYAAIHQFAGEIERPARTASIYQRLRRKADTFEPLFRRKALKTSVRREVQIPAHRITLPARPYLGLSDDDREQIVVMARAWLLAT